MTTTETGLPLLVLGRGTDSHSERGVECPGDLPPRPTPTWWRAPARQGGARRPGVRARAPLPARRGHPVRRRHRRLVQAGPRRGRPARRRSTSSSAACTSWPSPPTSSPRRRPAGGPARPGRRLLDGRHGRASRQVEDCLGRARRTPGIADVVVPVTYMNSSADIKAFCGRHGGAVCTSSNAERRAGVGVRAEAGRQGAVPARPAPRPQHRGAASWA